MDTANRHTEDSQTSETVYGYQEQALAASVRILQMIEELRRVIGVPAAKPKVWNTHERPKTVTDYGSQITSHLSEIERLTEAIKYTMGGELIGHAISEFALGAEQAISQLDR